MGTGQSGFIRFLQNRYTIYKRGEAYCFFRESPKQEELSLEECWRGGGQFLFCPGKVEEEAFARNGMEFLARWGKSLRFLWIENPGDSYFRWKTNKAEQTGGQCLFFDNYRLWIRDWGSPDIREDCFVFARGEAGAYAFLSPGLRLQGAESGLKLHTLGEQCGCFTGELLVPGAVCPDFMRRLDGGIRYFRVMEETEENAALRGYLASADNPVLTARKDFVMPFRLTPQSLFDSERTKFFLAGTSFSTNLSVDNGEAVTLTAKEDGGLVFQKKPVRLYRNEAEELMAVTRLYLGPEGAFALGDAGCSRLLLGMSGTEVITPAGESTLRIVSSRPAVFPYVREAVTRLGTTSWVEFAQGSVYYCQPQFAELYSLRDGQLRYLELPAAVLPDDTPMPMLPFREAGPDTESETKMDALLYGERRFILMETDEAKFGNGTETVRAVNSQGMLVEASMDGCYRWVGIADICDSGEKENGKLPRMRFEGIDKQFRLKLQERDFCYVIDNAEDMRKLKPSAGFSFSVGGLGFSLLPEDFRENTDSGTMLILRYSGSECLNTLLADSPVFQTAMRKAHTAEGKVKEGYEAFVEAAGDAGFQGLLALNVTLSVEKLPSEVQFLVEGIKGDAFYATYLLIKAGKIYEGEEGLALEESGISGRVDYETEDKLHYSAEPPDYDYLTTAVSIQIKESRMTEFASSSEILLNRIFEAKAAAADNPEGNCVVLLGRLVEKDGVKQYQYRLKQCVRYDLEGSGIETVWIQGLNLTVEDGTDGVFTMSGVVSCASINGADLLGYGGGEREGLPFYQLVLRSTDEGTDRKFSMDYGLLDWKKSDAVCREGSFPRLFAAAFDAVVFVTDGQTPEEAGYSPITAPITQGVPGKTYQGIRWQIPMGSMGELSGGDALTFILFVAFWRGSDGGAQYYVGLKLPEVISGNMLKLQGIFGMGFRSVSLEKQEGGFFLRLHNFHIRLLGASFPKGNSDILVFSDGENVGWYAAYEGEEKDGCEGSRDHVSRGAGSHESD